MSKDYSITTKIDEDLYLKYRDALLHSGVQVKGQGSRISIINKAVFELGINIVLSDEQLMNAIIKEALDD